MLPRVSVVGSGHRRHGDARLELSVRGLLESLALGSDPWNMLSLVGCEYRPLLHEDSHVDVSFGQH